MFLTAARLFLNYFVSISSSFSSFSRFTFCWIEYSFITCYQTWPKVGQDLQGQRGSHGQPQPGHPDHLEAPGWHFWEKFSNYKLVIQLKGTFWPNLILTRTFRVTVGGNTSPNLDFLTIWDPFKGTLEKSSGIANCLFVYCHWCEENEMVFVSHEVPFPATSDRRSRVAGNGTEWEVKTIELSSPTSGGEQWAFLNFIILTAVKKTVPKLRKAYFYILRKFLSVVETHSWYDSTSKNPLPESQLNF